MVSTGRVESTQLYYEMTGDGPPLVLIHSGGFDRRLWDDQFFTLAERHTVIRYDVRGQGQSPKPTRPYSDVKDLNSLLQWLKVDKIRIVGLSYGGSIAIDFTLAHPEMVDALILVAPDVSGYALSPEFNLAFIKIVASIQQDDGTPAGDLWLQSPTIAPTMENPAAARKLRPIAQENSAFWLINPLFRLDAFASQPAIRRLAEIHAPTLLIVGDRHTTDVLNEARLVENGISGIKKVVIPGAGHIVNAEKPEEFNRAVLDFLRDPSFAR
jgi:3-oxoadipate enol-lactonase